MEILYHVCFGFAFRILLLLIGNICDDFFIMKYTDLDYHVFSDAANFVWNGNSPYDRQTYRYSPILAFMLTPIAFMDENAGKVIFVLFDLFTGYLIYKVHLHYNVTEEVANMCSLLWLYNPMCAIISTRGSSDSITTALMMLCLYLLLKNQHVLLGLLYGFTVHFRVYPSIYCLAFYSALSEFPKVPLTPFAKLLLILRPNKKKLILVIFSILGFVLPTASFYYVYGMKFIEEAFLYHLSRRDIKHNFSPYFYFMYLMEDYSTPFTEALVFVPLLIQCVLLLTVTWVFCSKEVLPVALFLQTFLFVTFNKVCTAQYFLWYTCFLPLNMVLLRINPSAFAGMFVLWFTGQMFWLLPAYYLEFSGLNTFYIMWGSGLTMFLLNVYIVYLFCQTLPLTGYLKNEGSHFVSN